MSRASVAARCSVDHELLDTTPMLPDAHAWQLVQAKLRDADGGWPQLGRRYPHQKLSLVPIQADSPWSVVWQMTSPAPR